MEVGLGPGQIVSDGDPAPLPKRGTASPNFWPTSVVVKRLDGLRCHLVRRYGDIMLDGEPALPKKAGTAPPILAHVYGQTAAWINMPHGTG